MPYGTVPEITGFEWDDGNRFKNKEKHAVECFEAEEIFFNNPLLLASDAAHSISENRMVAFGKTNDGRMLTVVFTIRNQTRVRVISARDMNRRERGFYHEHETQENSEV